jgi:hypothetical protein
MDEEDKVTRAENEMLEANLSEEEIKKAIDGSYAGEPLNRMASHFCFIRNSIMSLIHISWPWSGVLRRGR